MQRLLDLAAFHVAALLVTLHARVEPRASRHLCFLGHHDEFVVGTAMYGASGVEMVACERPGCVHVEQWLVKRTREHG